jgi:hypothetical protein
MEFFVFGQPSSFTRSGGGSMQNHVSRSIIAGLFLVAACGRGEPEQAASNSDLQRDLEAASSPSGLQLASQAQGYQRARFVSEIEQTNQTAPAPKAAAPRRVRSQHHQQTVKPEETELVAEETATVAEAPEPEPQPTTEETTVAEAPSVPIVAPRPAPAPVANTGGMVSGRGEGSVAIPEGIGGVIGVVIRGGGVGDDHCVPRGRRGRGGIIGHGGVMGFPRQIPIPQGISGRISIGRR